MTVIKGKNGILGKLDVQMMTNDEGQWSIQHMIYTIYHENITVKLILIVDDTHQLNSFNGYSVFFL